jgi:ribose-phosphate pyrophosphokinase
LETPLAIFAGRSNLALSRAIAENYGTSLGNVTIKSFSDGELYVKYEQSIRGEDLFIIQSTPPPGDNIIELLLLLDAAKRASVKRVTAVIPYFGYARQDRKDQPRVSIGSKLIANILVQSGADRGFLIFLWIICTLAKCLSITIGNSRLKIWLWLLRMSAV